MKVSKIKTATTACESCESEDTAITRLGIGLGLGLAFVPFSLFLNLLGQTSNTTSVLLNNLLLHFAHPRQHDIFFGKNNIDQLSSFSKESFCFRSTVDDHCKSQMGKFV